MSHLSILTADLEHRVNSKSDQKALLLKIPSYPSI